MNAELKKNKAIIREFMRTNYSDQNLAEAYAHAKDGKFAYDSCCCLIGLPTADHALRGVRGDWDGGLKKSHYGIALDKFGADADHAYFFLASKNFSDWYAPEADAYRRRILVPMLKAEMHRREAIRNQQEQVDCCPDDCHVERRTK